MALYRDQGIVLRTVKLGEADRIITVFTQERGKIRGVAKGVRKTKSKFGSRLEPLSHVALQLYEGRDLDTITQTESLDVFRGIRNDLDRTRHGMAMLEAVDQITQDREQNPKLYFMLLGALRALEAKPSATIVAAFYWKLLSTEGFRPVVDQCVNCGRTEDLISFDVEEGGVFCNNCRRGVPISEPARQMIERILNGGLSDALAEPESLITHEIESLATMAIEHHLERRLRAVHVMDS